MRLRDFDPFKIYEILYKDCTRIRRGRIRREAECQAGVCFISQAIGVEPTTY